jgi:hypothetical protein
MVLPESSHKWFGSVVLLVPVKSTEDCSVLCCVLGLGTRNLLVVVLETSAM